MQEWLEKAIEEVVISYFNNDDWKRLIELKKKEKQMIKESIKNDK